MGMNGGRRREELPYYNVPHVPHASISTSYSMHSDLASHQRERLPQTTLHSTFGNISHQSQPLPFVQNGHGFTSHPGRFTQSQQYNLPRPLPEPTLNGSTAFDNNTSRRSSAPTLNHDQLMATEPAPANNLHSPKSVLDISYFLTPSYRDVSFSTLSDFTEGQNATSEETEESRKSKASFNRYSDIEPVSSTMVHVSDDDAEHSKRANNGYINANFLKDEADNKMEFHHDSNYIITQAPLVGVQETEGSTYKSFWRMIWEQRVPIIVSLQPPSAKTRKAEQYWPEVGKLKIEFDNGVLCIEMNDRVQYFPAGNFEKRVFKMTIIKPREEDGVKNNEEPVGGAENKVSSSTQTETRLVEHLMSRAWEDRKVPTVPDMVGLLTEFRSKRRLLREQQSSMNGLAVVHCNTGVGRAGTFVVANQAIDEISFRHSKYSESENKQGGVAASNTKPLALSSLVLKGRRQRHAQFVQTEDRYSFLFTFLENVFRHEGHWRQLTLMTNEA